MVVDLAERRSLAERGPETHVRPWALTSRAHAEPTFPLAAEPHWACGWDGAEHASVCTYREMDDESGLQYTRARHYDPRLGRFVQREPVAANVPTEHYIYARNNPLGAFDPTGFEAQYFVRVDDSAAPEHFLENGFSSKGTGTSLSHHITQKPGHTSKYISVFQVDDLETARKVANDLKTFGRQAYVIDIQALKSEGVLFIQHDDLVNTLETFVKSGKAEDAALQLAKKHREALIIDRIPASAIRDSGSVDALGARIVKSGAKYPGLLPRTAIGIALAAILSTEVTNAMTGTAEDILTAPQRTHFIEALRAAARGDKSAFEHHRRSDLEDLDLNPHVSVGAWKGSKDFFGAFYSRLGAKLDQALQNPGK